MLVPHHTSYVFVQVCVTDVRSKLEILYFTMVRSYTGNIMSLLLSVLLRVFSTSSNANSNKRVIFLCLSSHVTCSTDINCHMTCSKKNPAFYKLCASGFPLTSIHSCECISSTQIPSWLLRTIFHFRVTYYVEFLPRRARGVCIILLEVSL